MWGGEAFVYHPPHIHHLPARICLCVVLGRGPMKLYYYSHRERQEQGEGSFLKCPKYDIDWDKYQQSA